MKQGGDTFITGGGLPFDAPVRKPIAKTTVERNQKLPIDLTDLQKPGKGPINFIRSAGRILISFDTGKKADDIA